MSKSRVYLGGEGPNELGSRCGDPVYQSDAFSGVIEALLEKIHTKCFEVIGATQWKNIVKFRAKGPTPNETRNVLGLVLEARRAGADVLAFVRDADDDADRPRVIGDAIRAAREDYPVPDIIGGAAVPVLEGWILAMQGEHGTEQLRKSGAQTKLVQKGIDSKDTEAMVNVVLEANLAGIPDDATSLKAWIASARAVDMTERP